MSTVGDSYFLNVDKPAGMTSRDVVNEVCRVAKTKRVGHAGTLDPMARGVLVIAVGKATRLVEYVQALPKTYDAEFRLGVVSDTDDIEGTIIPQPSAVAPDETAIRAALASFVGTIDQRPPAFSALKVDGKRAYSLARKGETVALAPRPVHIESLTLQQYAYPELRLRIVCGSGTYVRALARDLGEVVGTGGLMSALVRTAIGAFSIETAVSLEKLKEMGPLAYALPLEAGLAALDRVTVAGEDRRRFHTGQRIASDLSGEPREVAIIGPNDQFLGIASFDPEAFVLRPVKGGFSD
jgi:tRNA pseudouridine55 synthase